MGEFKLLFKKMFTLHFKEIHCCHIMRYATSLSFVSLKAVEVFHVKDVIPTISLLVCVVTPNVTMVTAR